MIALAFLAFSSLLSLTQGQGQVVVGGRDVNNNIFSSVEMFPPSDACSIPDLPQPREGPSLSLLSGGRLVVCGGLGGSYLDSCIYWVAGNASWTPFHTMSVARGFHTAWMPSSLPDSIVLLGGTGYAQLTAETVPDGGSFDLRHSGDWSCGIPDAGDTIVLTGGEIHNYVTRYNVNGFVEELPQLPENRYAHACSALPATGALVVAGGYTSSDWTSSVLALLPGAADWTPLASLPRPLAYAQASIVGGRLRVTGGLAGDGSFRSEVLEYHPEPLNQWSLMGHLQSGKSHHAVVGFQQLPCLSTETTTSAAENSSTTNDPPTETTTSVAENSSTTNDPPTETTTSAAENSSTTNDPPIDATKKPSLVSEKPIWFYFLISIPVMFTIFGVIYMIRTNCKIRQKCCKCCIDLEKEDINLDYGNYYYADAGERRQDVMEVEDSNPAYESTNAESNQATEINPKDDENSADQLDEYDYMATHDDYDYMG